MFNIIAASHRTGRNLARKTALSVIGLSLAFSAGGCAATADEWDHFKQATGGTPGEPAFTTAEPQATTATVAGATRSPKRKGPKTDWPALDRELYAYSYPSSPSLQSDFNPWGERPPAFTGPLDELNSRILAAAEVYRYQGVHFDGYTGSEDDGQHIYTAADGKPIAWFGDNERKVYKQVVQSVPDSLDERAWICVDLPVFALNLAGFPIREAMVAHFLEDPGAYLDSARGGFDRNFPGDHYFFRRVDNVRLYFKERQWYSHDTITIDQYFDPRYRPPQPYQPGDIIFMGHYGDRDAKGPFGAAKHSGIVKTVDARGMPIELYNMRTTNKLFDKYSTVIDQWREIKGQKVYFKRFGDRYSIIGHGRIIHPFEWKGQGTPTLDMAREVAALYKAGEWPPQPAQGNGAKDETVEAQGNGAGEEAQGHGAEEGSPGNGAYNDAPATATQTTAPLSP